jgi:hypothetical protein
VPEILEEFIASEDLRKLVEKVDPSIKKEAEKEAEKLEDEEKELEKLEGEEPSVDTKEQEYDKDGRKRYTAKTQPRDAQGKFRLVLARIKQNLGTSGNQNVIEKIQEAENLDNAGDYAGAVEASSDLIDTVDRLDSGALNAKSVENVRNATSDLGKVIANLPLPFENQAQKVRYSDLPAALKTLTKKLISRVEEKIGAEDAEIATKELRGFMSGSDYYSQAEISAQLNRMLRLLT